METKEKTSVKSLNDLIVINNDRIEGYETAKKETKDADLISLFEEKANESRKFKTELEAEIKSYGEEIEDGTKTSGKIFRAWMDIKAALTGKDRKAILSSCEFGEDAALKVYKDALSSDELPHECRSLVLDQKNALQLSHNKIKDLRDRA